MTMTRAWAEIDLSAIRQNYNAAAKHAAAFSTEIMAVVKADAYGHGAVKVAAELEKYCGAKYFAVATLPEALELCEGGIKGRIVILSEVHPGVYDELVKHENIVPSIFHLEGAKALSDAAVKAGREVECFLVSDTGMSRIGIECTTSEKIAEGVLTAKEIAALPGLRMIGVFTHYACADEADKASAYHQTELFGEFLDELKEAGITFPLKSICNSAALTEEAFAEKYDLARLGISLYGFNPSENTATVLPLKPAMAFRARVTDVKTLEAGMGISYGHTFVTDKRTVVATLSVGYADGYPRLLSGKASVIIDDVECPILGRVCMDQMMVDVTNIPNVNVGSVATLMGADKRVRADSLAYMIGTISYELVCGISKRVPRIYTNGYSSVNE